MNNFDKIISELSNQKIIITGELILSNNFRCTIIPSDLEDCAVILRNYGFKLQSIGTINSEESNQLEYFFTNIYSERDLLFSVTIISDEYLNLPSLQEWEPNAVIFEEYIMNKSKIIFENTRKVQNLFLFDY